MALMDVVDQKAFLGGEFATWLWFRSEQDNETLNLSDGQECEIVFEKDLVLSSEAGRAVASTLKGETPSLAPEAATALAAGKKVKRARVTFTLEHTTWQMSLNGETLDWGSLKIDTPPSLPFDESVPIRLNAIEEFQRIFSDLYGLFIDKRLDEDAWTKELRGIQQWIREKTESEGNE